MNKFITLSLLSTFWANVKTYITNALAGKADTNHTHDYAASEHTHNYAAASHTHAEYAAVSHDHDAYALKSDIVIATEAEINALFA